MVNFGQLFIRKARVWNSHCSVWNGMQIGFLRLFCHFTFFCANSGQLELTTDRTVMVSTSHHMQNKIPTRLWILLDDSRFNSSGFQIEIENYVNLNIYFFNIQLREVILNCIGGLLSDLTFHKLFSTFFVIPLKLYCQWRYGFELWQPRNSVTIWISLLPETNSSKKSKFHHENSFTMPFCRLSLKEFLMSLSWVINWHRNRKKGIIERSFIYRLNFYLKIFVLDCLWSKMTRNGTRKNIDNQNLYNLNVADSSIFCPWMEPFFYWFEFYQNCFFKEWVFVHLILAVELLIFSKLIKSMTCMQTGFPCQFLLTAKWTGWSSSNVHLKWL